MWYLFQALLDQSRSDAANAVAVRAHELDSDNVRAKRMVLLSGLHRAGVDGLLTEASRLDLTGRLDDDLALEVVGLLVAERAWAECVSTVERYGLVDHARTAKKADQLLHRCQQNL